MMKKKVLYGICGVLMIVSMVIGTIDRYQMGAMSQGYALTTLQYLDIFAARPLFSLCVGLFCALRLIPDPKNLVAQRIYLTLGIVLTLILAAVGIAAICQIVPEGGFWMLLYQSFRLPALFLIPGILLGLGLKNL